MSLSNRGRHPLAELVTQNFVKNDAALVRLESLTPVPYLARADFHSSVKVGGRGIDWNVQAEEETQQSESQMSSKQKEEKSMIIVAVSSFESTISTRIELRYLGRDRVPT